MSRRKRKNVLSIHMSISVLDFLEHTPTCDNSKKKKNLSYLLPTTRCEVRQSIKGRVGSSNPSFPDAERSGGWTGLDVVLFPRLRRRQVRGGTRSRWGSEGRSNCVKRTQDTRWGETRQQGDQKKKNRSLPLPAFPSTPLLSPPFLAPSPSLPFPPCLSREGRRRLYDNNFTCISLVVASTNVFIFVFKGRLCSDFILNFWCKILFRARKYNFLENRLF